jgi:threonine dehydratase
MVDLQAAARRIRGHVHRTPILTSRTLDHRAGATLFLKAENFQRSGSFKARGAHNFVLALPPEQARHGVVAHSSGNHGAAVALAARTRGSPAFVVVPDSAVPGKIESIKRYGGRVSFSGPSLAERDAAAMRIVEETGARFCHPAGDPLVIAGQGTVAVELLEDVPALDVLLAPVGGGGLLSGIALAVRALAPGTRVVGVEPELADDARESFRTGVLTPARPPVTIADGLRTALNPVSFPLIREHVDDIVTVTEAAIVDAMRLAWSVLKLLIEPSAAVPLAAALDRDVHPHFAGKRIGIVLSGGNVDLERLPL